MHCLPFDTGGKSRAAPTAKAGCFYFINNGLGRHLQGILKPLEAPVGTVMLKRQWVGDANPGKRQPLLAGQPGNLLRQAPGQWMIGGTIEQASSNKAGNIAGFDRAIGHATVFGFHFHQWFEPERAPRAVANNVHVDPIGRRLLPDLFGNLVGAQGEGGGIAGYKHVYRHDINSSGRVVSSSTRPSNLSVLMRPWISSFTRSEGPQAQLPRQYTGSRVNSPSGVVW